MSEENGATEGADEGAFRADVPASWLTSVSDGLMWAAARSVSEGSLGRKQATAFPPNFVHCIDSSHMMMTATARPPGLGLPILLTHD